MKSGPKPQDPADRFWSKVDKSGDCWIWTGSLNRGYGQFHPTSISTVRATHYAWMLSGGTIPVGMCLCHRCDNPSCVNPDHLWIGTRGENNRDKMLKGRGIGGVLRGEDHPAFRGSSEDTLFMRGLRSDGVPVSQIALIYGMGQTTVRRRLQHA